MSFEVLDATADRERWLELWRSWPEREPAAHPAYAQLFAREVDRCVCLASENSAGGVVLLPVIERPLRAEPWTTPGDGAVDLITPYGYGGPFCFGDHPQRLGRVFWPAFDRWAQERSAATLFARLSLFADQRLPWSSGVRARQPNVVCDLRLGPEALWKSYKHKARKNVNRARRAGLTVEIDPDGAELDAFCAIYRATLNRRRAAGGYYFGRRFFETIRRELAQSHTFAHVRDKDGEIVASELVLASSHHLYSFLGGTLEHAFADRPADLLKHGTCEWGIETGRTAFVLGGGAQGRDGILDFKLSFAPEGEMMFYSGERVLCADTNARLLACRARSEEGLRPTAGYFPAYRAVTDSSSSAIRP